MLVALVTISTGRELFAAEKRPIDVIEDNSFLIEEAYNQERGVVQHILHAEYNNDSRAAVGNLASAKNGRCFHRIINFHYNSVISFARWG